VNPLPISVLLLARDEGARLAALLPTLAFASQVLVVVDAATRDDTREVAIRYGAEVVERRLEDFGRQRQFGLEHCREPWILWIDADERLDAVAEDAVRKAVESDAAKAAGYRLERRSWFLGRRIRHCGWRGEKLVRLFRRDRARFEAAVVHESVTVDGPIAGLAGSIEHHSYADWRTCREKLERYAALGAEKARRAGRRSGPLDVLLRPPLRFARMYVLQAGFLDGAQGAALCALASAQVLLKYLELWADPTGGSRKP
jgi:glycosyltransferase involved in cell wall biosynthesis